MQDDLHPADVQRTVNIYRRKADLCLRNLRRHWKEDRWEAKNVKPREQYLRSRKVLGVPKAHGQVELRETGNGRQVLGSH